MSIGVVQSGAIGHNQKAASQASRTNFSAGKTDGKALDQNWPKEFENLTGIPNIDAMIEANKYVQSVQVDFAAGIVSNPTVNAPITDTPIVTVANIVSIVSDTDSTTTVTPTTTQLNNGQQETNGGYNGFRALIVAAPTFSPVAGPYVGAQSITISSATFEASIKYTTDGSTPSPTHGTLYSSAISVAVTETVKAIAYKTGFDNSSVSIAAYTIS